MTAQTVVINGYDGDEVQAYLARPDGEGPRGGMIVIHHMPGYDRGSKEIVRVTEAEVIYVAVGDDGKPIPVNS